MISQHPQLKRQSFARSTIPMLLLEPLFADPNAAQDYTKAIDIWRSRPVSELLGLHSCGMLRG